MYALLIAEDPDDVAIFSMVLQRAGLAVSTTQLLDSAIQNWTERPADIILVSLAEPTPEKQTERIRAETLVPLILAPGPIDESRHTELLKLGADLIITSPFSVKVLIAQVGVLLRRGGSVPSFSLPSLTAAGLTLDPATRTIDVPNKPAQRLTQLEFRLLYTLMMNREQVIPTETIVERVWGYTGQGDRDLVRGLVSRLRVKVEPDPRQPRFIVTVSGIGYTFKGENG
jgi:DNA-binding response OmpR family regulator